MNKLHGACSQMFRGVRRAHWFAAVANVLARHPLTALQTA